MKTKPQFPIILLTVLAMTACGGSDDGEHATQKKTNDTRPQKILQLKKFLGPSFWHLFRSDPCEH